MLLNQHWSFFEDKSSGESRVACLNFTVALHIYAYIALFTTRVRIGFISSLNYYCDSFSYSLTFCNGVIKSTRDIVKDVYYTRFMLLTDTLVGKLLIFVHD